jgi:pimeloyl-ACP methyl ester carboxylesterase
VIVILHGWSDEARSFRSLAAAIRAMDLPGPVTNIVLGDYVTMDDDVSFDDLAEAMTVAWSRRGLPTAARSVDLVVHSTGALVARHWMTRNFTPESNPIRRFVMLAPANFGSPLAHKGTSFLGRVVKGFKSKRLFHTGKRILSGLEMASPFTWNLAIADRFSPTPWYGRNRVLATSLVGTRGYTGIAAMANEEGSDGTVLVSTANLNPARLALDFATDPQNPRFQLHECVGRTAFCRLPGDNHSTVAFKDDGPKNAGATALLRKALQVTDDGFEAHCDELAKINAIARRDEADDAYTQGYQNTVLWVRDSHEQDVHDYVLEAFAKRSGSNNEDRALTEKIQTEVLCDTHVHGARSASRALKFNCDRLQELLAEQGRPLHVSITASPDIRDTKSVGYSTVGYNDVGSIQISASDLGRVFQPDRTLLVDLKLKREQLPSVFEFAPAGH